jgi:hypothetical protein
MAIVRRLKTQKTHWTILCKLVVILPRSTRTSIHKTLDDRKWRFMNLSSEAVKSWFGWRGQRSRCYDNVDYVKPPIVEKRKFAHDAPAIVF